MNLNRILLLLFFFCMTGFSNGYAQTADIAADTLQACKSRQEVDKR